MDSALINTLMGGGLTLAGGFAALWWTDRQSIAREVRERKHEREVWARNLRQQAHAEFLALANAVFRALIENEQGPDAGEPLENLLAPVWDHFEVLRMVSDDGTIKAAERLVDALRRYAQRGVEWGQRCSTQWTATLLAVRSEFGLDPIASDIRGE